MRENFKEQINVACRLAEVSGLGEEPFSSFLFGLCQEQERDERVAPLENEFRPGFWHRPIIVHNLGSRVDSTRPLLEYGAKFPCF